MENDETMIPDKDVSVFKTPKGINEDIVREISAIKGEPEWMLEYRLKALDCFLKKPMPTWGVDLSRVDFDEYTYYIRPSDKQTNKWEEVPETIKDTFDKLGIPEAEQKYLSGVTTQYESEVVYHNMLKEVQEKGVIFLDIDSGLREYPELFKKYFDCLLYTSFPPSCRLKKYTIFSHLFQYYGQKHMVKHIYYIIYTKRI